MAKKIAHYECSECSEKFNLSAKSPESISYCPFCGASISIPYDDVDEEYDDAEYDRDHDGEDAP